MPYSQIGDRSQPVNHVKDDICDYIDQPLDLNQENIRLFEQQQHFQHQQQMPMNFHSAGTPAFNMTPNGMQWQNVNQGLPGNNIHGGPYMNNMHPAMAPVSHGPHEDGAFFRSGSVGSNIEKDLNSSYQQQWGSVNVGVGGGNHTDLSLQSSPPGDSEVKVGDQVKSRRSKSRILSDQEEALLAKDDKELTEEELKIKKKAHNRLAQRAFRERKRTELKDLETKLLQSEEERHKLVRALQDIKLTYASVPSEDSLLRNEVHSAADSHFSFPGSQDEFIDQMVDRKKHNVNPATVNKVYDEPEKPGNKVLAVGAVWDFLQIKAEEDGYEGIDMFDVMQTLRGKETCHGYGPAYKLDYVMEALEKVRREVHGE